VLCDDLAQPPERCIHHPGDDFWVRPLCECREAHHVSEQDGGELALLELGGNRGFDRTGDRSVG
jgi:hypothetical protein